MDRRRLLTRCGQALLGIGAAAVGVKAATVDAANDTQLGTMHIFVHTGPSKAFDRAVVKAVVDDVSNNGRIREAIGNSF